MQYLVNLSIFRHNRNFLFLFIGQCVSLMGTMIVSVALPYQIYTLTHSTLMVGILSLCQLGPLLFTALLGGAFADRYHRRLLLLLSEALLACCSLVLAYNAAQGESLIVIFLIAMVGSAITGLHRPALDSIVQQIVAKEDFPAVGSLASIKASFCMIAGPALGGLLVAHSGLVVTYLVDVSSFVISLCALLAMTGIPKPLASEVDESTFTAIKSGFRYAFSRQELIGTYLVDFVAMIFGMPTALFPALALKFGGATSLGLLYSAPAMGALVVAFFSGWARHIKRHGAAIAVSAALWGVAMIGFGLSQPLWLALLFLAIAGGFDAISGIYRSIMWNETIPNQLRGRLAGIEMISYLSGPRMGDAEAGLVASLIGVEAAIVSGGVLCVIGVAICCWSLPIFWRYRATDSR